MGDGGFSRRNFLGAVAGGVGAAACLRPAQALALAAARPAAAPQLADRIELLAEPFPLAQVRLLHSPFADAFAANDAYLRSLPTASLAHSFRLTAGLASSAQAFSGWEAPQCQLRGHFTGGHYLSACALRYAQAGDDAVREQGEAMIAELAACQKQLGSGYVSAFPETLFDHLEADQPVWAPFYTLHKILAGCLDMHAHCGSAAALEVAAGLGDWTGHWIKDMGDDQLQRILQTEFGGMEESLWNLAAATGERRYAASARRFEKQVFFDPLAAHRDQLKGLHANTHIPQVIGAARRYELTGEPRDREIAHYFWHQVVRERSYAPGGTSNGEHWDTDPGQLARALSRYSMECCCGYNMLKLTRHLYTWTADPRYFDYYERTLWNSRLGTQHAPDGGKMYYFPTATGWWKYFSSPRDSFWCCDGTGAEEFSKFGNSIYFHHGASLFVNLYLPSELHWPELGLALTQQTRLPEEDEVRFSLRATRPVRLTLQLRIPAWTAPGGTVSVNGRTLETFASPGSYVSIERSWSDADTIVLRLPMQPAAEPLRGDTSQWAATYGPLVLAARLSSDGLPRVARFDTNPGDAHDPYGGTKVEAPQGQRDGATPLRLARGADPAAVQWLAKDSGLRFHTVGQASPTELMPLHQIQDERYGIYWKLAAGRPLPAG
ncbi:MAG: beta-L-arabinofuranosidase domain-containing protein [Terriglobales bacterium]